MNLVPSDRFYALFEQMVEEMNNIENFDRDRFVAILTQLSEMFRISKGVTEFYTNENKEKIGEGEIIIDYDNGKGGPAIIYHRIVTKSQAVIKGTIYRAEDEEPLSECDLKRLDLIVLQLLSFVARNRLASAIEALGFYDDVQRIARELRIILGHRLRVLFPIQEVQSIQRVREVYEAVIVIINELLQVIHQTITAFWMVSSLYLDVSKRMM